MIVFDEMNLAPVERWFAPFISLLELEGAHRKLSLYSSQNICHNQANYPSDIEILNNVLFVGTANLDETTNGFSDRMLDRINLIALQKMPFADYKKKMEAMKQQKEPLSIDSTSYDTYRSWVSKRSAIDAFTEEELAFLDLLHEMINEIDEQKGVSYRILKYIGAYLNNIPVSEEGNILLSRKEAIDIQFKQRIMTKIRGRREQFEQLIGILQSPTETVSSSQLYELFTSEQAQQMSEFTNTLKEINRKARGLYLNGYAE